MPKPKKLRVLSARIIAPTPRVASMMSSDATFGRMWRRMMVKLGTPMNRAALT
jgi:hypothetical protein